MINPKPCPFCGAEAKRSSFTPALLYRCSNIGCGASNYWYALDSWNRRPEEDKAARAGVLSFINRVEEGAAARVASDDWDDPPYTYAITTAEVFDQLASELKAAK